MKWHSTLKVLNFNFQQCCFLLFLLYQCIDFRKEDQSDETEETLLIAVMSIGLSGRFVMIPWFSNQPSRTNCAAKGIQSKLCPLDGFIEQWEIVVRNR